MYPFWRFWSTSGIFVTRRLVEPCKGKFFEGFCKGEGVSSLIFCLCRRWLFFLVLREQLTVQIRMVLRWRGVPLLSTQTQDWPMQAWPHLFSVHIGCADNHCFPACLRQLRGSKVSLLFHSINLLIKKLKNKLWKGQLHLHTPSQLTSLQFP